MADIIATTKATKSGKPLRKQLSTRIDFTPMVDLGFLLITFFIFTTALSTPSVMKLNVPTGKADMPVGENKTLNLVLYKNNTIGYYFGSNINAMQLTNYSPAGIRKEIQLAQKQIAQQFGDESQLYVVIKPTSYSTYKNVVDVLDEMLINNVTRYILTEATDYETDKVEKS